MTLRLDPKNHRKMWRKGQKICDWCGYSRYARIHGSCIPLPDYHDAKAYGEWMRNPGRPTVQGKRKKLNEYEQGEYERWREEDAWKKMKDDEMYYD